MADSNLAPAVRLVDQISTIIVGKRADRGLRRLPAGRRPPADRRRARRGQDHAGACAGGLAGAEVLARAVHRRPDAVSDLVGVSVFERSKEAFNFHPGPVFTQVLLADEINRAGPKTQSALLEAMEEQQVSVENETRAAAAALLRHRHPEPQRPARHLPAARKRSSTASCCASRWATPTARRERALLAGVDRRHLASARLQPVMRRPSWCWRSSRAAGACVGCAARLPAGADRRHPLGPVVRRGAVAARRHRHAARGPCARPDGQRDYVAPDDMQAILPQAIAHRLVPVGRRARARRAGARHGRGRAHSVIARRRIRRWFENRLPLTDSWTLTQRNIYILPTKAGWCSRHAAADAAGVSSTTSSTWATR
jgi:MoxR-like ATPase